MAKVEIYTDEYFMKMALREAEKAYEAGEVPIGAVVVCKNHVIAKAHNQVEMLNDVTAHAEILAVTAASSYLGSKYLIDCSLFVTLEPCMMCSGALKWSQISRVVYGAGDEKNGFMRFGKSMLHSKTKLEYGVLNNECLNLVKQFFEERRLEKS